MKVRVDMEGVGGHDEGVGGSDEGVDGSDEGVGGLIKALEEVIYSLSPQSSEPESSDH